MFLGSQCLIWFDQNMAHMLLDLVSKSCCINMDCTFYPDLQMYAIGESQRNPRTRTFGGCFTINHTRGGTPLAVWNWLPVSWEFSHKGANSVFRLHLLSEKILKLSTSHSSLTHFLVGPSSTFRSYKE